MGKSLRVAYGEALVKLGAKNDKVVVLDADLAHATQTCMFKDVYPDRHFNMGIAEANMMCAAAGFAHTGYVPFVSTFALFGAGRAFEQIRNSICYTNCNVKFGFSHSGLCVGEDGGSHQSIEDIALMRELPHMTIFVPCDPAETEKAVMAAAEIDGPVYIRVARPVCEIHPKELQKLLDQIEGSPEAALLTRLTLRSMKQAKYTTDCMGHFGLSTRYYTHFTSPIRRYPDLQIHRIIKESLKGGLKERREEHYGQILPGVAAQTSALERRADEAERETGKLKKCEYMSRFVGQSFDGVISGVTNWGLYVELPNTVEGLVRIGELRDDYYIFDEHNYQLTGELTKKTYKLGQPIRVEVSGADKLTRTVDFLLSRDEGTFTGSDR